MQKIELSPEIEAKLGARRQSVAQHMAAIGQAISGSFPSSLQQSLDSKLRRVLNESGSLISKNRHLQILTSEARAPLAPHIPCRRGCAACCHVQVELVQSEAEIIGQAIGRVPVKLPPGHHTTPKEQLGHPDTPCPFLKSNECSIYDVRPFVCRYHVVADVDNLLCGFENLALAAAGDDRAVPIPVVQAGPVFAAYRDLNEAKSQAWADIRQFFPREAET